MRPRAVFREAWLNVFSGASRAVTLSLVCLLLGAAFTLADLTAVLRIDKQAQEFRASGASVLVLTAPGNVDGRLCEALDSLPGVRAAGALRSSAPTAFASLPQQSVPLFEVSPGFPKILDKGQSFGQLGVVLSRDAARAISAQLNDVVSTVSGQVEVTGIYDYPQDGRARGYGYAVLAPITSGNLFDECWVDQWPQSESLRTLLLGALAPNGGSTAPASTVSQLNSTLGQTLDANALFVNRITIWVLPLAFITAFLVATVAVRIRRLELTSALHLGVSKPVLLGQLLIETAIWLTPLLIGSVLIALWYAASLSPGNNLSSAFLFASQTPAAAIAGGLLGTATTVLTFKESQLFRYFKER